MVRACGRGARNTESKAAKLWVLRAGRPNVRDDKRRTAAASFGQVTQITLQKGLDPPVCGFGRLGEDSSLAGHARE